MKQYTVYIHRNIINGKRYIGLTSQTPPSARWGNNGINYRSKCPKFWAAIQKYGWDNFEHEIVAQNLSRQDALNLEIELIQKFHTQQKQFGYNILAGGEAPVIPPEVRAKMSLAMRGNKNGLGIPCSDEKRRKISEAQKGRTFTDEHRQKISAAKKGKPSCPCSEEKKRKISESHFKTPVICVTTDTIYESIQACSKALHIDATSICACCKGKHHTTHGLQFQYYCDGIKA